jgi:DNA-binding SARP family transcriptional activator
VDKPVQPVQPAHGGRRRVLDALGAAVAAGLVFCAVPAVLVLVVGNPLRGGLGHTWHSETRDVLCALVLAAWVAWAFCCAQLVRGVAVHVRSGTVGLPVGASVIDRLAARIAVGVLALTSVGAPLAITSAAGAESISSAHAAVAARLVGPDLLSIAVTDERAERVPVTHFDDVAELAHIVRPGETLWSIADARSGDGADWTSIAALNLGLDMPHGDRFIDPDHLRPGWHLRLPPDNYRHSPPDSPRRSAPEALRHSLPDSSRDTIRHSPPEDLRYSPPEALRHSTPDSSRHSSLRGTPREGDTAPRDAHLPELTALGLGSIVSAALARRARRRRGSLRHSGAPWRPVSDDAADTAALLGRFDGVPALESFEAANCLLGRSLHDLGVTTRKVRAVCVGPDGVTFVLAAPSHAAPEGFDPSDDGTRWVVSHQRLDAVDPFYPAVPVALPVGTDDEGTWFVALVAGDLLPVLGQSADALCRAARAGQEAWSWSDLVVVTDDPADAALARSEWAVFFGDPSSLDPRIRERAAVVTTSSVAASDLTVLVDRHGASIHPLGRTVQPQLLDAETFRSIRELTSPDDQRRHRDEIDIHGDTAVHHDDAASVVAMAVDIADDGPSALLPGSVEVRLLTSSPRIDGLPEEIPPNRSRRAVELVAYLALHHPDAVTSDRLRTRVLGSSDADAASKTLFNTAHAARRAMGPDSHGEPLFPPATRVGLYQVSEHVSIDVHRAVALADEGKRTDDPELAMAYLRAALELVESEPLAHALAGYAWWEAEGHGGQIATVLVDAACTLARLALEAGHFELARRGIDRARLVEPYSEALSRCAMEVAAAQGDAERLRLEWLDCQRRVDALDPGSSPSHRTESLYGELSSRVLVETTGSAVGDRDWSSKAATTSSSRATLLPLTRTASTGSAERSSSTASSIPATDRLP